MSDSFCSDSVKTVISRDGQYVPVSYAENPILFFNVQRSTFNDHREHDGAIYDEDSMPTSYLSGHDMI